MPVPRKRPKVFIGSSNEGRSVAEAVVAGLEVEAKPRLWAGVFQVGGTTLRTLVEQAAQVDFAVVVATADDDVEERGVQRKAARDNILFEAGLFVGALGPERTLLLHPSDLKLPSDLLGFTTARYDSEDDLDGPITRIREAITRLGRRGFVSLELVMYVPQSVDPPAEVHVAGTLDKIDLRYPNWVPGIPMEHMEPGDPSRWRVGLEARDGTGIEYKYMAGPPWDWSHVETLRNGDERENRTLVFRSGAPPQEDVVEAWR
jgi:hypothetical protein